MDNFDKGPSSPAGSILPQGRISAPEFVDWHMILDQELEILSKQETGIIGAIGFMAFGAMLGNGPAFVAALSKPYSMLNGSDITAFMIFAGCTVASVICLTIFALSYRKANGLPEAIRARGKPPSSTSEVLNL